jgi:hypothetical protein
MPLARMDAEIVADGDGAAVIAKLTELGFELEIIHWPRRISAPQSSPSSSRNSMSTASMISSRASWRRSMWSTRTTPFYLKPAWCNGPAGWVHRAW